MLPTIQLTLKPLLFVLLLVLMFVYWGETAYFSNKKDNGAVILARKASLSIFYLAFVSLTSLLLLRWVESGHFPLSNLYESLLFLSWSFLLSGFLLQWINPKDNQNTDAAYSKKLLGCVISPLATMSYAFAFISLPKDMQKANSLVPALQSNWLMMHVSVMILSYALLLCGSILSMAFLLVNFMNSSKQKSKLLVQTSTNNRMAQQGSTAVEPNNFSINEDVKLLSFQLDNWSYRLLGLAFPLLTGGILSGAVWANSAWGSYWSWDPKETWALITWIIYAMYLHARITKGWSGQKPAILATVGFFVVWFCYLGVNLIATGLHSYGWFNV